MLILVLRDIVLFTVPSCRKVLLLSLIVIIIPCLPSLFYGCDDGMRRGPRTCREW
ncbi:hypothetical protein BJX65DRAFT_98555 [Aspergillus insuetus]